MGERSHPYAVAAPQALPLPVIVPPPPPVIERPGWSRVVIRWFIGEGPDALYIGQFAGWMRWILHFETRTWQCEFRQDVPR